MARVLSTGRPASVSKRWGVASAVVPPTAWLLSLGLSYVVEDFTCAAAEQTTAPEPGAGLTALLVVLNVSLLVVTALAGVVGLLVARSARGGDADARVARFTGHVGIVLAAVFAFGIVLIGGNVLALEVCG